MFKALSNLVEGTVQTVAGTAKAGLGVVTALIDEGDLFDEGITDARKGLKKIGSDD